MPKYKVIDGHKKIGGKLKAPGDIVDVSEEVAKQLRLEPVKEEEKKKKEKE
ncbi:MAG: hypothetical protein HZB61_10330 [Nitrospirae bacterium]|nr:hypothetical protein [Nitrospirota bacterium]